MSAANLPNSAATPTAQITAVSPLTTLAWWIWLLGQAGLLAMYAGRVKLSGGYPEPVEATADVAMAIGQLVLAALLSPLLSEPRSTAVRAIAVALPMAVLATALAGRSIAESLPMWIVVAAWLVAIGRISRHAIGRFAAIFITIALPLLFYAAAEYGPRPVELQNWPWRLSPVLGICSTRLHGVFWTTLWVPLVVVLVQLSLARLTKRRLAFYCKARNDH